MTLNAALARLGRNPRDLDALTDAGQAALTVGDVDAAIGFFRRAEQVTPGNPRVKAGLARALVRSGNPFDAIPLFDEAERAGPMDAAIALDRGLAYDLVADNATAQRYYRNALASSQNEEAVRRLALSLAIAGDKRASGSIIAPLLMRQDQASWRARAFALAILGQTEEAITVVNGTLPPGLAAGIAPYLRYMPKLTPAQQAAAANFGQFPRASEIGRDDPRVALYSPSSSRRPAVASADSSLIPAGEPLGRNSRSRDNRGSRNSRADRSSGRSANLQADRQRPPEVAVALTPAQRRAAAFPAAPVQPVTAPVRVIAASPPVARAVPPAAVAMPIAPLPRSIAASQPSQAVALPAATAAPVVPAPPAIKPVPASVPLPAPAPAPVLPSSVAAAQPVPPAPPLPPTPRRQTLAEAFSDLGRPMADATPASGAVDIRRIRPARVPGPGIAPAAPAAPVHPSRIWVQLATGRDKTALGYDFRRIAREAETALKSRRPFVSNWGQTNRLLTGPFESEAAANAFMSQLRRANVSGAFAWTSPAGQVVDVLAGR